METNEVTQSAADSTVEKSGIGVAEIILRVICMVSLLAS